MKKSEILKQMCAVVEEVMTNYKSDFYNFDKPKIECEDFKFPLIWIVGSCHTHMFPIGEYRDLFFHSEAARYDFVSEGYPCQYFLNSPSYKKDHWFLVSEAGVQPITRAQAKAAILDYINPAVQEWVATHGPLPKSTKVKVFMQDITLSKLKELFAESEKHDDHSLAECLRRFHNYRRVSSDQYVKVYYDGKYNEFAFGEYIDGKCRLSGRIIFHGWPETGYQSNNSVQIDPSYGWSSHT